MRKGFREWKVEGGTVVYGDIITTPNQYRTAVNPEMIALNKSLSGCHQKSITYSKWQPLEHFIKG